MFNIKSNLFMPIATVLTLIGTLCMCWHNSVAAPQMPQKTDSIVLGMGCFWGAEKRMSALPGVVDVVSGYAGGGYPDPSYRKVIVSEHMDGLVNYAEVVKVTFDPTVTSVEQILVGFWENHNPTQGNRQGQDVGSNYRSAIFYYSEAQKQAAVITRDTYQKALTVAGLGKITTEIAPLKAFYRAEEYHQDYLAKNPNGYCPNNATGVTFAKVATIPTDNSALLKGKQIVVLEAEHCPFCEKFKQDVTSQYRGSIPMTFRMAAQLDGLALKTPTWATPTIYFIDNGKEVFGHQGYMTSQGFYKALGYFKLGDSEAYKVAFAQGTDSRFCRQYEEFKDTPDGVFVDKLSGAPLFDTRDRFNSGTGWLSFTGPVDGATIARPDNSFGLKRIEVLSKSSGVHLGHVFDDGPDGMPRYCINATVLEFRPRNN